AREGHAIGSQRKNLVMIDARKDVDVVGNVLDFGQRLDIVNVALLDPQHHVEALCTPILMLEFPIEQSVLMVRRKEVFEAGCDPDVSRPVTHEGGDRNQDQSDRSPILQYVLAQPPRLARTRTGHYLNSPVRSQV